MIKIVDESILFFSCVFTHFKLSVRNLNSQVSNKQGILSTRPHDWNKSQVGVTS